MPACCILRKEVVRRVQQRAPLQLLPCARFTASAPGEIQYIRGVAPAAKRLVRISQSHERRGEGGSGGFFFAEIFVSCGLSPACVALYFSIRCPTRYIYKKLVDATDQLGRTTALARSVALGPQMAQKHLLSKSCISDHFEIIGTPASTVAFLSSSKGCEGQSNSVTCGGGSSSGINSVRTMTSTVSSSGRMIIGDPTNSRRGVGSRNCSWSSAAYSTAAAKTEPTKRGLSRASKQSDIVSNEEEAGQRRAVRIQGTVQREGSESQTAGDSCLVDARRAAEAENEGKRTSSETFRYTSSDSASSPEHGISAKKTSAASSPDSPLSSESATPVRFIRVNRPGSARKPGYSQASSGDLTTCSSDGAGEGHDRNSEQQELGKGGNEGGEDGQAVEGIISKGKDVYYAKNVKDQEVPFSRCGKQIGGQEEEFGFKYEGPEPTTYGDWSHKGRVTDF